MRKILIVLLMSLFFISPVYADNHVVNVSYDGEEQRLLEQHHHFHSRQGLLSMMGVRRIIISTGIHMMKAYIRQEMRVNLLSQVLFQTCSLLQIV